MDSRNRLPIRERAVRRRIAELARAEAVVASNSQQRLQLGTSRELGLVEGNCSAKAAVECPHSIRRDWVFQSESRVRAAGMGCPIRQPSVGVYDLRGSKLN